MKNNLLIIIVLIFISCKEKGRTIEKGKKEVKEKVNPSSDNELIYDLNNFKDSKKKFTYLNESFESNKKTVFINDIFYTATMLPKKYYIKKYIKAKDSVSHYLSKLKTEEVIQFDFQALNQKDLLLEKGKNNYKEYIKYISFKIKKDFYAITNKGDTIKPKGVFFERTYKLTPYKRVLLYFNFPEEVENVQLVYYDNLFENNILKFRIKK